MTMNGVPPVLARVAPHSGVGSPPFVARVSLEHVAYGLVDGDEFSAVARVLDPHETYFFAPLQWRVPHAVADDIRAAAACLGVPQEPLVRTWAASERERIGSLIEGIAPPARAKRLWETAAIVLYNRVTIGPESFIERGLFEYTEGVHDKAPMREWRLLLSAMSYARAALDLREPHEKRRRNEFLGAMTTVSFALVEEWHETDTAAHNVLRMLLGAIALPPEKAGTPSTNSAPRAKR